MMTMEEWHEQNIAAPRRAKQWVSAQALEVKRVNKLSKRDIEREIRIEQLGGKPIEVLYGKPLTEELRKARLEIEWDLKYPKRKEKKSPPKRVPKSFVVKKGKKRCLDQVAYGLFNGAKIRAKAKGLPFDLELTDVIIPKTCPVLGIPLKWSDKITNETPSIDRLVPEKGYIKSNCMVISMKANRLKNNASKEELEAILRYVSGNIKP